MERVRRLAPSAWSCTDYLEYTDYSKLSGFYRLPSVGRRENKIAESLRYGRLKFPSECKVEQPVAWLLPIP